MQFFKPDEGTQNFQDNHIEQSGDNSIGIIGNDNNVDVTHSPTQAEEENEQNWQDGWTAITAFFSRLNRYDYPSARILLDKYLVEEEFLSEENLTNFMNNITNNRGIRIENDERKTGGQGDSEYISKRTYEFTMVYNRKDENEREVRERWEVVAILHKKDKDYWQIGSLECVDLVCEDNPLLD